MFTNAIAENAGKALGILNQYNLCKGFYLAGGTSVAIQLGHRISVDLDFFSSQKFNAQEFADNLLAKNIEITDLTTSEGTVKFILKGARVSFFYHPYPIVGPLVKDFAGFENIHLASLLDIGLMKISAIANRGSKKDFVDLYFISKTIGFEEILNSFDKKYKDVQNLYHFIKALVYFADADSDPDLTMLIECDWEKVKAYFVKISRNFTI